MEDKSTQKWGFVQGPNDSTFNAISTNQRKENANKYGEKQFDVISDAYRVGRKEGDVYAGYNAIKYIKRYTSNSKKAQNLLDLRKALDYITRMIEYGESIAERDKPEVIEK